MDSVYMYGVMGPGTAPAMAEAGIGNADVAGFPCGQFDALVSYIRPDAVTFEADAILAHERVLTRAMEAGTVIPAAFGHLFPSAEELCQVLESAAPDLVSNLAYLAGRVELGIKATWKKDAFLSDIETDELREMIRRAQEPGADPARAIEVGQVVEALVNQRRDEYVAAICPRLEEACVEIRLNDPVTTRMVFNGAFLVEREAQESFFRLADQVVKPFRERLDFQYSGPWPAHNFARVRIGAS